MKTRTLSGLMGVVCATGANTEGPGTERLPVTTEQDVTVVGQPVDYRFFPGEALVVSHGEFRLENRAARSRTCRLLSCAFVDDGVTDLLPAFHVYAGDRSLPKVLTIPPATALDVRVTFAFRPVHVGIRFNYAVRLSLECEGHVFEASSVLHISQEQG